VCLCVCVCKKRRLVASVSIIRRVFRSKHDLMTSEGGTLRPKWVVWFSNVLGIWVP